jgi:flagellar basal-body rod protein FlgG
MAAQQTGLETVANNLANMNTPGYKRSQVVFEDLMYREAALQHAAPGEAAAPLRLGTGTRISGVDKLFVQGTLQASSSAFDLAINGDGLIGVQRTDGGIAYSRGGHLRINDDGLLALGDGTPLNPPITIPPGAQNLSIDGSGKVSVTASDGQPLEVGRIDLVLFNNPSGLKPLGANLFQASDQSGEALIGHAGEDGRGVLAQKFLEGSNVQMADELVNMMLAQRAFEANSKVLQAADEMLAISNNLRRS